MGAHSDIVVGRVYAPVCYGGQSVLYRRVAMLRMLCRVVAELCSAKWDWGLLVQQKGRLEEVANMISSTTSRETGSNNRETGEPTSEDLLGEFNYVAPPSNRCSLC